MITNDRIVVKHKDKVLSNVVSISMNFHGEIRHGYATIVLQDSKSTSYFCHLIKEITLEDGCVVISLDDHNDNEVISK